VQAAAAALPATHKVQPGESLTGIARKYNVTLDQLYAANGGRDRLKNLQAGQVIRLSQPAAAPSPQPSGQTAQQKAPVRAAAVALPAAQKAQPVQRASQPAPQKVQPSQAASQKDNAGGLKTAKIQVSSGSGMHVVQPGETLWSIARAYNMQPGELLKMNNMTVSTKVQTGSKIKVKRQN
jgi:membrane-bound lytic murein transglycosylase D